MDGKIEIVNQRIRVFWPEWTVVRQIGEGSFGGVYQIARQIRGAEEHAALKVIAIPKSESEIWELENRGYDRDSMTRDFSERLDGIRDEYAMLARMKDCTNVVSCEDIKVLQQDNGVGWDVYIKMELLTPLTIVARDGFTERQTVRLGLDICNALIYCENNKVIHRDIKPENIFLTGDRKLYKLGDFGIARTMEQTTSATITGTYEYMAPEVYNNRPYNAAVDIYSLGLVLYHMLNERMPPFLPLEEKHPTARQRAAARSRRFGGEPLPAPVHGSEELKRIVLKACAYDPAQRYATAAQMREELEEVEWQLRMQEKQRSAKPAQSTPEPPAAKPAQPARPKTSTAPQPKSELPADNGETVFVRPAEKKTKPKKRRRAPMAATIVIALALCFAVGIGISGNLAELCPHVWQEATCTQPKTCYICGAIEGEILSHNWQDATLSAPKTCKLCGATEENGLPIFNERLHNSIAAGVNHTVGLKTDGTVLATGTNDYGQCDVLTWNNIVSVAANEYCTIGLRVNGTVVTAGKNSNGCLNVSEWRDITSIAAGKYHTVGLKMDGTVVAAGKNEYGQCAVKGWKDITAIVAGARHTVALKTDGTVVAAGENWNGVCEVDQWKDIVAIAAGENHTIGLKADGTVVATGYNENGQCDVADWSDIVAISVGTYMSMGLKADGTVVMAGKDLYRAYGQVDVSSWSDIVAISAGRYHAVGLKADGTVVVTGATSFGRCDVSDWKDILVP